MIKGFDVCKLLIQVLFTISFLVCWLIGPMAAFDNPIVLNWFFIFGHSCDGMITTIITVWALYYASKLKKAIAPALVECQKGDPMLLFAAKVWLLLLPEKLFSD